MIRVLQLGAGCSGALRGTRIVACAFSTHAEPRRAHPTRRDEFRFLVRGIARRAGFLSAQGWRAEGCSEVHRSAHEKAVNTNPRQLAARKTQAATAPLY